MELYKFNKYINHALFKTGFSYFIENRISSLDELHPNFWQSTVKGNKIYKVIIELSADNIILKSMCDCLNNQDTYCKHEIASYLALHEKIFPDYDFEINEKITISKAQKDEFEVDSIVNNYKHSELKKIASKYAIKNEEFRNFLAVNQNIPNTNKNEKRKKYKKLIKNNVESHIETGGYINFWNVNNCIYTAEELLTKAEDYLKKKEFSEIIPIVLSIIEELIPIIKIADDNDGILGETISYAFELLNEVCKHNLDETERKELFEYCLTESHNPKYRQWTEWITSFLFSAARLIKQDDEETKIIEEIDRHIERNKNDDFTSTYYEEFCLLIKYEICSARKSPDFTENFIKLNLHYPAIKEIAIKNYINQRNYKKAEETCLKGIEQSKNDKNYAFLKKWHFYLQKIYHESSNKSKLKSQAKYNFVTYHNFDSYEILKALFSKTAWEKEYNKLLKEIEEKTKYKHLIPTLAAETYLRENNKLKLLETIKSHPVIISEYDKFLLPDYSKEVAEIYIGTAIFEIDFASDIKEYKANCILLKKAAKLGADEQVNEAINNLKSQYYDIPDLIEELEKIF